MYSSNSFFLPPHCSKECLVTSSGIDNTENGLSGSKADSKPTPKKKWESACIYNYMSPHIYVPSLHIFVYAHVFPHMQIHYVQVGILKTLPGCGLQRGIYTCAHNATTCAWNSYCADDIQLKIVQIMSAWVLPETLQLDLFRINVLILYIFKSNLPPGLPYIYLPCPHWSTHYQKKYLYSFGSGSDNS